MLTIKEIANDATVEIPVEQLDIHQIHQHPFGLTIKRMTAEKRERMAMPGVLSGFLAVVMVQGTAHVQINGNQYDIERRNIIFLRPKDVFYTMSCSDDVVAYLIISSGDFMNSIQIDFSTSAAINTRHGRNPILSIAEQDIDNIVQIAETIKTIKSSGKKHHLREIIGSLFTSIFYMLTDINPDTDIIEGKKKRGSGEVIFHNFMSLLNKHNKRERNVQFYAEELGISTKYLSVVVKKISGKSAAKWIDESVILEAKALLSYSTLSIYEIAQELNFSTQSFFGKYFKHHTGVSPSRFKRR